MRTMTRRPSRSGMIRPQTSIVNGITSCMQIAHEIDQTYFPVGQDTFMRHEIVWRSNPFRATSHQIRKGSLPRWRTPRHRRAWGCIKAIPRQERTN
jgi:hypothetical protein